MNVDILSNKLIKLEYKMLTMFWNSSISMTVTARRKQDEILE
jgi:hypothetical protein